MHAKISEILHALHREFGWKSRLAAMLGGPFVSWKIRQERKRRAGGWTYEPPTFYEKNHSVVSACNVPGIAQCRFVTPSSLTETTVGA
jgi:hypothetical protein